jgi:hypothetical protein
LYVDLITARLLTSGLILSDRVWLALSEERIPYVLNFRKEKYEHFTFTCIDFEGVIPGVSASRV